MNLRRMGGGRRLPAPSTGARGFPRFGNWIYVAEHETRYPHLKALSSDAGNRSWATDLVRRIPNPSLYRATS
jgi:hypothetical protein